MVKKQCPGHEGVPAKYICTNQECKLNGFFCDLCAKDGKHSQHTDDWMSVEQLSNLNIQLDQQEPLIGSDQNDNNNRTFHDNLYYQGNATNRNSTMYATIESLGNQRIISEPEDLKEYLSLIEEKVLNKLRQIKSALLQKMIEFKNQYHHINMNALKKDLQEKRLTPKEYNQIIVESNNYLGIDTTKLQSVVVNTLQMLDSLTLQKFEEYDSQKAKNLELKNNNQVQIQDNRKNGEQKQSDEKKKPQQNAIDQSIKSHLSFSVAPFYKPTSQIEFFNNQRIIKAYNSDEAVISSKPLKQDNSYYLNFSISPNGDSPTFGVMLVQEDCLQGEICFMHQGQISFVSDLNENTASLSLMKQKGLIVRPAHDIFWIDINLSQHTFNIYDEQKNMFFQIDRSKSPLNKKKNWYLAFHLYDITLQIL